MSSPLRVFFQFSITFSRVAWSILDCARRTSTFLSCAFREQEDDQAARLTILRPRVARAQKINQAPYPHSSKLARLVPWEWHPCWFHCGRRARPCYFPEPLFRRSGQGCPRLRESDEHSFIVRVLRARRAPGRFLRSLLREQGISTGVIPSHLLGRVLLGVSKITITGQGKIRFTPLMRVFKIPRFLDVNRFESQAVESPID